jgi:dethiobiotin synthetase
MESDLIEPAMSTYFVTSTGTGIGKTYVMSGLIRHYRSAGRDVDAVKPIVTDFDPKRANTSDPGTLLGALELPVTPDEIERVAPFRYAAALSPDMAAQKENRSVDFNAIVEYSRRVVARRRDVLLIEGIGGIMVPIDDQRTVLDWMVTLHAPLIMVVGSYLGTISHTLTALDVVARRNLSVAALVVNQTEGSKIPVAEITAELARFAGSIPVVALGWIKRGRPDPDGFAALARTLGN